MNTARIDPDQIPRSLQKPINRNVGLVQVVQHRPPGAVQVVDLVLLAQRADGAPVRVGHREPLAIARADVDVNRAEVVVLLVPWSPAPRHFHVQLDRVHAQNHVPYMREHVPGGYYARKRG